MMSLVFEKLTQALTANQIWPMKIAANEARIVASAYPVTLEFRSMGQSIGTASNVQAGDYFRGVDFDEVVVVNGATAQNVTLGLVSGQSGSDRITGEVSVISGEVVRSKAGVSYFGSAYCNALAANYSHSQLWNPAISGVSLVVNQIMVASSSLGAFFVNSATVALATKTTIGNPASKKFGANPSVAENRIEQKTTTIGTGLTTGLLVGSQPVIIRMTEPIILPPGYGLVVGNNAVNADILAGYQFYQEAI